MEKQFDHQKNQSDLAALWEQQDTYSHHTSTGPLYSIDTPPPTVSGTLHIGHIFSYTQTDIIARYKRMSGYRVFYPFGFDDNGLATERFVEKKRNIQAHQMPRSEFIKICLEESHAAEHQFQSLWKKIGLSAYWQQSYSTISDQVRKLSQKSFLELVRKGYVYRAQEPALYCTVCRTSVAQAELDDKQEPGFFNDIVFKDAQGNDLIIGTTRPELLSACVALLYNPEDIRYKHLEGTQVTVPLYNFQVPVIADEKVEIEKGTGLVMCCTFGDKTDIEWMKKYKLPYKQAIGFDGKFLPTLEHVGGLKVAAAREAILTALKEQGLLLRQQPITHAVNIHERCKKEIEYMMLEQWFLSILNYKKEFIALADQINWYPAYMKSRYINWVENLSWDWCLSRQRFFGIPFPVWYCQSCHTMLPAQEQDLPIDPQETPYPYGACPHCSASEIRPDTDVMDTWNTSSITPYICANIFDAQYDSANTGSFMPMSMRPQAHDIIRTWAFYTIVKSWMHQGIIPWKDIVISGHVLSSEKQKISKSQGNNPLDPENLLATYSADAIRYWTASGSLGTDISFSDTQLKIGSRLVTKLWNAYKFVFEHASQVSLEQPATISGVANQWLLARVNACINSYNSYFAQHEFSLALHQVEQLFWNDFCDNYLELIKDQLFNRDKYAPETVASTVWCLSHVGLQILQLYAPFVPFITEALYQEIYKARVGTPSLHQTRFATDHCGAQFAQSLASMQQILHVVQTMRKLKTEKQLSLKTEIAQLTISGEGSFDQAILEQEKTMIQGVTQARSIVYTTTAHPSSIHQDQDQWFAHISFTNE